MSNGYSALRIPVLMLVVAAAGTFAQAAVKMTLSGPDALESGDVCLFTAVVTGAEPGPELEWSVLEGQAAVDCWLDCHDGEILFAPPPGDGIRWFTVQARCGGTIATQVIQVAPPGVPGEGGAGGAPAIKRLRAPGPSLL